MKIRDFLNIENRTVITIEPDETASIAVQRLVENEIGAMPVCNSDGMLLGIVSERDLLKECLTHSGAIGSIKVKDVMTKRVAIGSPDDDMEYAKSVMKQKRVRHLPITVDQKLFGIVSMRDLVDMQLEEVKAEIHYIGLIRKKTQRRLI